MRALVLLAALPACKIDSGLTEKDDDPQAFETADTVDFGVDTAETSEESAPETDSPPPTCKDQWFRGQTVPQLEECYSEPTVGTFTPVIKWTQTAPGSTYTTPAIGQLTDDNGNGRIDDGDIPDVAVANTSGALYVVSGDDGRVLWNTGAEFGSEPMSPAIGDLDGDGWPEVVSSGSTKTTAYAGADGTVMWNGGAATGSSPQCGAVGIADVDGDGEAEVLLGRTILEGDSGSLRGDGVYGAGSGHSWAAPIGYAADQDQDGVLEVLVGNAAYDADGNALWYNGETDGYVAIAQFDGDDAGEMVVTRTGSVRLQDDDGSVIWSGSYVGATSGPPTVADFDGDGEPEIGVAGNGEYEVIEADGTVKWTNAIMDFSSGFTGSSVFDFEGDGVAEVVFADENDVYVFDGPTGAVKLKETTHSSATCSEYPAVADVDNDGHAEIIYTSSQYSGSEVGVRAIGDADASWAPGRTVWNQHAYSITNVEEDGEIPVSPDTNWHSYNNFRSGDLTPGEGYSGPDLYGKIHDVCIDECSLGNVTLWIALGNQGYNEVKDQFLVEVIGTGATGEVLLYSTKYTVALPAGTQSESMTIELTGVPTPLFDLRVEVDGGNSASRDLVSECYEDNNETTWGAVVCP